ncbi:MAG: transferase [Lysobacteraceae bacterium]
MSLLGWWARWRSRAQDWLAQARGEVEPPPGQRRPIVRRGWRYTSMQFTREDAQSRMLTFRPQALLIGYTRTMMGFLRLHPRPRRLLMIGLGGGSLAKYCHRHLPDCAIDVVEINPHVLALRRLFRVPRDDARFRVHLDDGAQFVARRPASCDVLLVDGYDERGIPPALASQRFYDDCRAALREGGVMSLNLYCDDVARHLERIARAFDGRCCAVPQPGMSNQVAFAWVGVPPGPEDAALPAALREDLAAEFARVDAALAAAGARD